MSDPSSRIRRLIRAGAIPAIAVSACGSTASAELIYGLTNLQQLVKFDSNTRTVKSTVSLPFSITGEILVGIDVRPATGELFAVSNQSKLYKLDPNSGAATPVGGPFVVPLSGNVTAIDFNPAVDRLRIVTSSGLNMRVNPNDGNVVDGNAGTAGVQPDGTLFYPAGDPNFRANPGVVGAAYTNNFPGTASTKLYVLDPVTNRLELQDPNPNSGNLNSIPGASALGIDVGDSGAFTGFDISSIDGTAFLTANNLVGSPAPTPNALYSVNLTSGAATLLGGVSGVNGVFRDIAVATIVPEPAMVGLIACGLPLVRRRG